MTSRGSATVRQNPPFSRLYQVLCDGLARDLRRR
jgi:hypothetical protein